MAPQIERHQTPGVGEVHPKQSRRWRTRGAIAGAVFVLIIVGFFLVRRADHRVNRVALGAAPRPVTIVKATSSPFRDSRSYVGAVDAWVEASLGPQYISAYVDTVIVRPGAVVTHGQVLATLDCSHPSAASRAIAMQARALSEHQRATTRKTHNSS